jgi:protein phosphatase
MSTPSMILPGADGGSDSPQSARIGSFDVAWVCTPSPARRGGEDAAFMAAPGSGRLVGFAIDGMGGMARGEEAARRAAQVLAGAFAEGAGTESRPVETLTVRAIHALRRAHAEVLEHCPGGGATVAGAVLEAGGLRTLHAGDAEVIVISSNGTCKHRTPAHSPVGRAVRRGLMNEDSALVHPERHLVSNGLGVAPMSVHLGPRLKLDDGDTVLIATDGLTDNAREEEIVESLRGGPLLRGASHLVDLCRERMLRSITSRSRSQRLGKADDLTALVLRNAQD